MKVLLVNGSPHTNGCTYTAIEEVAKTLNAEGIETEKPQPLFPPEEQGQPPHLTNSTSISPYRRCQLLLHAIGIWFTVPRRKM